jgi:Protein of unknown function (DUF3027)
MADALLLDAVDIARAAAVDASGDPAMVGAHLRVHDAVEGVATHLFACELPGYRGWVWEVAVAGAPHATEATICEAHLIPADDALLAPPWVPYEERVQPGDLEPGMTLPFIAEDPRLVPGFSVTEDDDEDAIAIWEMGLGRERVLGPTGRDDAAERWHAGSHGPTAPSAIAATAQCATCAFLVPLAGSMRGLFGACANEWSSSDGEVVSLDHGCGAHSQTDLEKQGARWPGDDPVIDTQDFDPLDLLAEDPPEVKAAGAPIADGEGEQDGEAEHPAGTEQGPEAVAEPLADDASE